ncbi:MAG: DUF2809 domain-containing protein [Bacteroidota bacterium]
MQKHFTLKPGYLTAAILLLITEVLIALYVHDGFIRPYAGDFLAVVFLYCAVRSFIEMSVGVAVAFVLCVAYALEVLQYMNILRFIGMQHAKLAVILLGSAFEWMDMLIYTLAAGAILLAENRRKQGAIPGGSN